MQDKERENELLLTVDGAGENARILAMTERGELLGWTAVELSDSTLRILKLSAGEYDFSRPPQGEEIFVLDTLLRSAASFGETFGADFIETAFPDFYGFLALRGFTAGESRAFTPMSTIVTYGQ